jgi:uncharacterized protein (TIGR00269 family)
MVQCETCLKRAVFSSPLYCKDHFIEYIENKVKKTIDDFRLINSKQKIAVAVSGGKDSLTVLYLLHELYGDVTAIAIDEGIPDYRNKTLEDMKTFCSSYGIPYQIYSFKEAFGKQLSLFIKPNMIPCRSCGVLRRHLLNKHAQGFDVIATGHNLDDECQSMMMNVLKGNSFLSAKIGPKSGIVEREGFTQRVKPLYLCTEKEIAAYTFLKCFPVHFTECPHARFGFRSRVRDILNEVEMLHCGAKQRLVKNFLNIIPRLRKEEKATPRLCRSCGSPSMNAICKACMVVNTVVN